LFHTAYNDYMNTTQEQLAALIETVDAGYRASVEANTEAWKRLSEDAYLEYEARECNIKAWERLSCQEEDAYLDIMEGGYGDIEYESDEFIAIVIRRIKELADELGLSI